MPNAINPGASAIVCIAHTLLQWLGVMKTRFCQSDFFFWYFFGTYWSFVATRVCGHMGAIHNLGTPPFIINRTALNIYVLPYALDFIEIPYSCVNALGWGSYVNIDRSQLAESWHFASCNVSHGGQKKRQKIPGLHLPSSLFKRSKLLLQNVPSISANYFGLPYIGEIIKTSAGAIYCHFSFVHRVVAMLCYWFTKRRLLHFSYVFSVTREMSGAFVKGPRLSRWFSSINIPTGYLLRAITDRTNHQPWTSGGNTLVLRHIGRSFGYICMSAVEG